MLPQLIIDQDQPSQSPLNGSGNVNRGKEPALPKLSSKGKISSFPEASQAFDSLTVSDASTSSTPASTAQKAQNVSKLKGTRSFHQGQSPGIASFETFKKQFESTSLTPDNAALANSSTKPKKLVSSKSFTAANNSGLSTFDSFKATGESNLKTETKPAQKPIDPIKENSEEFSNKTTPKIEDEATPMEKAPAIGRSSTRKGRLSTVSFRNAPPWESNTSNEPQSRAPIPISSESSVSAKENLKMMIGQRKSLAPNAKELNAILLMAKTEDSTQAKAKTYSQNLSTELSMSKKSAENLSSSSRTNWIGLFRAQSWASKSAILAKMYSQKRLKSTNHVSTVDDPLTQWQRDLEHVTKIEQFLAISPENRAGDVIQALDKIIKPRFGEYGRLSEPERYHICKIMRLERHKKDTVLLWEEHLLTCFHMIVTGQVEIFKLNKDQKYTLLMMGSGTVLGLARAKVKGATRAACAVLSADSVFLVVDKDAYLGKDTKEVVDPRILKLKVDSKFFLESPAFFTKIALFFEIQTWEKGDVIQGQNNPIDNFFWIIEGSCSVSRDVPFVSKTLYGKTSFIAYNPGDHFTPIKNADGEEKMVSFELQTQENLEVGDWFPYIPLPVKSFQREFEKEDIFKYRLFNNSEYTVTAMGKVSTVRIGFDDFMDLAPKATIESLEEMSSLHRFDLRMLQNQYLEQRAWENMKKTVVSGIVKK